MPQLAFPTAKGAGAYITGGRGGQVIHVTNLNPTGPGSLVEALQTPGARQIVFDVGGTIDLRNTFGRFNFVMSQAEGAGTYDNVTINGQTAPGGITIESSWFGFNNVRNVIWRYVRFSHDQIAGANDDIVTMNSREQMFDHCSFTHGNDEGASVYGASLDLDIGNITFQNNLFFNNKTGMIIGGTGDTGGFTVTQNLFVGTSHRFPNIGNKTDAQFDIINNIVYNYKSRWVSMGSDGNENADTDINFIGNYYKISSASRDPNIFGMSETYTHINANQIQEYSLNPDNVDIYTGFNKLEEGTNGAAIDNNGNDWNIPTDNDQWMWTNFNYSGWGNGEWNYVPLAESPWFVNTQHPLEGQPYTILSPDQAYSNVIADVGANKYLDNNHNAVAYRTPTDALAIDHIVNDSATDDGGHKDALVVMGEHTTSVTRPANWATQPDGIPNTWKTANGLDINVDYTTTEFTQTLIDANSYPQSWLGYVGIEVYLNEIDGDIITIDLTDVEVNPATITLNIPNTTTLSTVAIPSNASNKSGVWSSSDESIATVSQTGIVTSVAEGSATITFTANDTSNGTQSDSCVVTVTNVVTNVTSVTVSPATASIGNIPLQLSVDVLPINATNKTGAWSSSDINLASVDNNGLVTGLDNGTVTITFTSNDNNSISDDCLIAVDIPNTTTEVNSISSSFADLKETIDGASRYNSTVEFPYDAGFSALNNGLFFTGFTIPKNKVIESSNLKFTTQATSTGAAIVEIYGQKGNNPVIFTDTVNNIKNRIDNNLTTSFVSWDIPDWNVLNEEHFSPDLSSIIQEIIDDPNYVQGDDIVLILKYPDGGVLTDTRHAFSYDYDPLKAVELSITYNNAVSGIVDVTDVTVVPDSVTIAVDDVNPTQLSKIIAPTNASDKTGLWESLDEAIVSINQNGVLNPIAQGQTSVTFITNDGAFKDSCVVTVNPATIDVTGVSLDRNTLTIEEGESDTLITTIEPSNASNKVGVWSTSDTNIVSMNQSGVIGALSEGIATITFTTNDGGFSDSCVVTVKEGLISINVFIKKADLKLLI